MAGMLDQEFKNTMINMLRTLMEKVDKWTHKQKYENSKKELKRNARGQKQRNQNKECFSWAHYQTGHC